MLIQVKTKIVPIERLGECTITPPFTHTDSHPTFITDEECVIYPVHKDAIRRYAQTKELLFFELAGPREKIYFNPQEISCGIVTCGGLCPGINNVIRSLVIELSERYGVKKILGFRYGYKGLTEHMPFPPLALTPDNVDDIHLKGGTILSSSRGHQDTEDMVRTLQQFNVKILFIIGGDGTIRGGCLLAEYITQHHLDISVIAIPKTIDNDINYIERSFGFETAVEQTVGILEGAHAEAKGAPNGIGLVKVMGRYSGFIAAYAALANSSVNFCLIPEVPFRLCGEGGLLEVLEARLARKEHAVIVVAEGAGQDLMERDKETVEKDASGNIRLKNIGTFLKDAIEQHFKTKNKEINVKYIDPSYILRSIPANAMDAAYCLFLAQAAAHAGMTGRTNMVVGFWNQHYIHVPMSLAIQHRKDIHPYGRLWKTVMEATLQPYSLFKKIASQ